MLRDAKAWVLPLVVHITLVVLGIWAGKVWLPKAPAWGLADYDARILQEPQLLQPFLQWDSHWQVALAADGYEQSNTVIFPLMALCTRFIHFTTRLSIPMSGLLVANVCWVVGFFVFYRLGRAFLGEQAAQRGTWAFALFPTSFYLNCYYTESLFILCCLLSFRYILAERWWLASLVAGLAALTRNTGVLLALPLAWGVWHRFSHTTVAHRWVRVGAASLGPILALASIMGYHYVAFGDAWAFVHNQAHWQRSFGWPWMGFVDTIKLIIVQGGALHIGSIFLWINLLSVCWALVMYGVLSRSFSPNPNPWGLLVWVCMGLLVPLVSQTQADPLIAFSRYILVLFPLYWGVRNWPLWAYRFLCIILAVGLWVCTSLYSQGWWIA